MKYWRRKIAPKDIGVTFDPISLDTGYYQVVHAKPEDDFVLVKHLLTGAASAKDRDHFVGILPEGYKARILQLGCPGFPDALMLIIGNPNWLIHSTDEEFWVTYEPRERPYFHAPVFSSDVNEDQHEDYHYF